MTLLRKVRDLSDQEAWERFLAHYRPTVTVWCLRRGLQQADADEIAAIVLEKLARAMPSFEYDRSKRFRAWLFKVVNRTLIDFRRRRVPGGHGTGDTAQLDFLEQMVADERFSSDVEELTSQLHEGLARDLDASRAACARVQGRVSEHVWQAFWLTAVEERSGSEVAEQLGVKVASVFVYKNRVIKMLRQELAGHVKP